MTSNEKQLDQGTATAVEQHESQIASTMTSNALKKPYLQPQLRVYGRLQHMTLSGTVPPADPGGGGEF